jgi:hypothetical protein
MDLMTATANESGCKPSSWAASVLVNDTTRCGHTKAQLGHHGVGDRVGDSPTSRLIFLDSLDLVLERITRWSSHITNTTPRTGDNPVHHVRNRRQHDLQ